MISHLIALDPGQIGDPAAYSVIKSVHRYVDISNMPQHLRAAEAHRLLENTIHLVHLEQHYDAPYPKLVERGVDIMEMAGLKDRCMMVVLMRGVGQPVLDMFMEERVPTIGINENRSGTAVTQNARGHYGVPVRDLVTATQRAYDAKRLIYPIRKRLPTRTSPRLREHPHMMTQDVLDEYLAQMQNYERKIGGKTNIDMYEGKNIHDDLVRSVLANVWYATQVLRWLQANITEGIAEHDTSPNVPENTGSSVVGGRGNKFDVLRGRRR